MKTELRLASALALLLLSAPAFAAGTDDYTQLLLGNPMLRALGSEINKNHGGACTLPSKPDDITWGCTGALPQVHEPTITGIPCFFFVQIRCPNEAPVQVNGTLTHYELVMPNGHVTQSTQPIVTFDSIGNAALSE